MPIGIGAALLGGSILGGGLSLYGQHSARKAAQANRDFQEGMSNTAYTRAVTDMKNAGLNPVLAAGQPASTPGGATAQIPDIAGAASRMGNSAMAYKTSKAGIQATEASTQRTKAETAITETRAEQEQATWTYIKSNPALLKSYLAGKTGKDIGPTGLLTGMAQGANSAGKFLWEKGVKPHIETWSARKAESNVKRQKQWRKGFQKEMKWLKEHEGQIMWRNGKAGILQNGEFKPLGPDVMNFRR